MESYTDFIATHYQAYRPPLHAPILQKCLGEERYSRTLDVGCGTGVSSFELTKFSNRVLGYDISKAMLEKTISHPNVTYSQEIPQDFSCDLICYFGSVNYIKKEEVTTQLDYLQVGGKVICCDFQVLFDQFLQIIPIQPEFNGYNHKKNLSFYGLGNLKQLSIKNELSHFFCSCNQAAHLLLCDSTLLNGLQTYFELKNPYHALVHKLRKTYPSNRIRFAVICYFSSYEKYE